MTPATPTTTSSSKRSGSPLLLSSSQKRPKPTTTTTVTHPNLLLHQRLNTLQEALTQLQQPSIRANPTQISALLARASSLGRELEAHFHASAGAGAGGGGGCVCPAVGCGLKLSKTCHLRRHVRTKAAKCRFHAEVLTVMNATSCRFCGRSFTRREDVTRHEGRCVQAGRIIALAPPPPQDEDDDEDDDDDDDTPAASPSSSSTASRQWSAVNTLPAQPQPPRPSNPSPPPTTFSSLLSALFTVHSSTLPPRQLKAYHTRIAQAQVHKQDEVAEVLRRVLETRQETPAWGREQIVAFMAREQGVESWAPALARALESVVFRDG